MDFFLARQPIFDRRQDCVAYEILARTGPDNFFCAETEAEQDNASREVLGGTSLVFGFEELTFGKLAFINTTRGVLLGGDLKLLPTEGVVIELLEDIPPEPEVIAAVRELKSLGYQVALDDFVYRDELRPLVELVDIVKVDFRLAPPDQRLRLPELMGRSGLSFLAEKVETATELEEAVEAGYDLFQGYFFAVPTMLRAQTVPGSKLQYIRVMAEMAKSEFDLEAVAQIVSQDPSLTYNLLRQVNSVAYGFLRSIESVREAIVLLGQSEVRKIVGLVALLQVGDDKPDQLLCDAITRGRFCESVAIRTCFAHRSADLFLLGMFSLLDTMIGRPMPEVLERLGLPDDLRAALLGQVNPVQRILELAKAYERGQWDRLETLRAEIGIDEAELPPLYVTALAWTQEHIFSSDPVAEDGVASVG